MTNSPRNELRSLKPLSDEALTRSMAETMAAAPAELWLFAYGSLIWSPCFAPAETRTGVLRGYRRAFNFWSIYSRGTPERPGLALGLEAGGTCRGVLLRIAAETRAQDLDAIWRREMFSSVYKPCWLPVECEGAERRALCFVTDETHPQYAEPMLLETTAEIIAQAEGIFGPCRDYLFDLLHSLSAHGISEPGLDELAMLVRACKPA